MSSSKSRRSRFGCAKKLCHPNGGRKTHTQLAKSREAQPQFRKEQKQSVVAHVPGSVQLRNNLRRSRKLRPSRYGLGPLSDLSRLREAPRSEKPVAADGIPR